MNYTKTTALIFHCVMSASLIDIAVVHAVFNIFFTSYRVNNLMGHIYSYFAKYLQSVVDRFGSILFCMIEYI